MVQEEITILRVHKDTRDKLRRMAIAKRESYDEIINRLLGEQEEELNEDSLEERKQKLLRMGISKEIVNLVGIMPKTDMKDDKEVIRQAVKKWASKKG